MNDDILGNFFGESQTSRKTEGFSRWALNSYFGLKTMKRKDERYGRKETGT
jgi:hypothetical protein